MVKSNISAIEKVIKSENITEDCLVILFNKYCDINNYDYHLYHMKEFEEKNKGRKFLEVISSLDNEFEVGDNFFYIDENGNYVSSYSAKYAIENISFIGEMDELAISITENWCEYCIILPIQYQIDILSNIKDLFMEWAKEKNIIPIEWLDCNVNKESTLERNWDEYLNELAEDYKSEIKEEN